MANLTISKITRTHSIWRYLFPLQSIAQFVSAALIFMTFMSIASISIYLLDSSALFPVLSAAAIGGAYFGFYPVLPACMVLNTKHAAIHHVKVLNEIILSIGYAVSMSTDTCYRYQNKLPPWLSWKEQDLEFLVHAHAIEIKGPIGSLRSLEKKMKCMES
jgi:hypothetical protein